jgi:hypothetical protein
MNERIKQLAEQANVRPLYSPAYAPRYIFEEEDLEKFTELIVAECVEQSMSIGRYNTPSGITPDLSIAIVVGLKKHFGVEE